MNFRERIEYLLRTYETKQTYLDDYSDIYA